MNKLKQKKYIALLLIVSLVIGIITLISYGRTDKYKGLINVNNTSIKSKLVGSVGNATLEDNTINGNSTIEYIVSFTLDEIDGVETRDAIIKGSLTNEEFKYAHFKPINGTNIESTLLDNGKEIEVRVNNVRLGEEKTIKLKLIIENAPNTVTIHPSIRVSESTGNYTSLTTDSLTVQTNSLEGQVKDENNLPVGNIEVIVRKDGRNVKKTYTNENGFFVITDLEEGTYELDVDEEMYQANKVQTVVSGRSSQNLKVIKVEPYKIETHKYINRLKLIVDGQEKNYTYNDQEKVLETIRRANTISGEIEYKLVTKNIGEKTGIISQVKDEASEGLKLKEGNNGWEEVDGTYYYRPLEGVSLAKNESREVGLVLEIESTSAAKTYINKMTTKGEMYEKVVYILDGEFYKEEEVLEGEKIEEPIIGEDFSGWYTDQNKSNKYNFNLPVTKDLILYGFTDVRMCEVKFMDFGTLYNRQEIVCGTKASEPENPVHEGYTFVKWEDDNGDEFDPEEPIDEDIIYYSNNELIYYNITYKGITSEERTTLNNPVKYTIESETITLNNPENRVDTDGDPSEQFVGWIPKNETTPSMTITIPTGSTGDREYTASWIEIAPDEYPITYDLGEGHLEDGKTNPSSYNKKSSPITLNNPVKDYYEFIGWTGTDLTGETMSVTIPTGSTGARHYVANYRPTLYHITYDLRDGSLGDGITNPTEYTYESPDITLNNPTKEGYNFIGWNGSNSENPELTVVLPHGSHGDKNYVANYEIIKYNVIFMDEGTQFARQTVDHGSLATMPNPSPTKPHNLFIEWLDENNNPYVFSTPVTRNITLHSSYREIIAPNISHTPTEWTNQNVLVTIGLNGDEYANYTFYYAVDGGEIHEYTGPFEMEYNCNITAHSMESGVTSVEVTHPITNIDKEKPLVDSLSLDYAETTRAKIDFSSHDDLSGLKEVKVYIRSSLDPADQFEYKQSFNYAVETRTLQTEEYIFEGLEDGVTYIAKLVAYDHAGNISDSKTLEFTTEEEEGIVCRLIGYNNVDYDCEENPALCKTFPSLNSALNYIGNEGESDSRNCLTNKCYIQMLESVNESNNIVGGQSTKLDLNGKTINGVGEYTFNIASTADFQVVDHAEIDEDNYNELNHNSIKNEINKAIINNGTFTLGEGNDGEDVSIYVPLIKGKNTGVDTVNGIFNFYDGRIIATNAISGEVSEVPLMFNANVEIREEDETYQVAMLKRIADVEARIGSKYYTRLSTAIEEANNGGYRDVLTDGEFMDSFDKEGNYGFIKEGNFLVNENTAQSSTAKANMVLDLREYDTDQYFSISTNRLSDSNTPQSDAIIRIYKGIDSTGELVYDYTPGKGENTGNVKLEAGERYYVSFYYKIFDGTLNEKLYITALSLRDYIVEQPSQYSDMETTNTSKVYGFDYDPVTKTLKSNNQYTSETTAFSYYEVDLTNETSNKKLIINASLSSMGNDIGSIFIKTNNDLESSNNYYNAALSLYGKGTSSPCVTGPMPTSQVLQAGQKYYVQFYYFKQYSTTPKSAYMSAGVTDQFIINSFDLVDDYNVDTGDIASGMITPGDHGFTPNSYTTSSSDYVTHSYIPINLTTTTVDMYAEIDFYSYYDFMIFVTDSTDLPTNYDTALYRNPLYTQSYSYYGPISIPLNKGQMNYIHFVMPAQTTSGSTQIKSVKMKNGKAYNIMTDFHKSSGATYGFETYRYSDPIGIYNNSNGVADSYVPIDLRYSDTDVVLSVDQQFPSDGTAYMYISDGKEAISYNALPSPVSEENKNLLLKYAYNTFGYIYGVNTGDYYYSNHTFDFVLSRGKQYYLHFGNYKDSNYYKYYISKIITKPVNAYSAKIGKQRYITQSGSSSGIPDGMAIDDFDNNNLRFIGSGPDNYISFNGELWRILGVYSTEDENGDVKPRIKIVRNSSIGTYSWDTSNATEYSPGTNDWTISDIMRLLNPGYDSDSVNNSLYWNKASGTCYTGTNTTGSCDFSSSGLSADAKSFIDKVKWNIGMHYTPSSTEPINLYEEEKQNTWLGKVGLMTLTDAQFAMGDYVPKSDGSPTRTNCINSTINTYAACYNSNNWVPSMFGSSNAWFITASTLNPPGSEVFVAQPSYPNGNMQLSYSPCNIFPSVYLSTKTIISGGEGTMSNPYTITLGDSDNEKIDNYYGLIPEEEEEEDEFPVIDYETDDYQNVKQSAVYGFEYDSETDSYISNNANAGTSTAASYIEIDRTAELEDTTIKMTYSASSDGYYQAIIALLENSYDENIDVRSYDTYSSYKYFNVQNDEKEQYIILEAGKKYYFYLGFYKQSSSKPSADYREDMRVRFEGLENSTPSTIVTKYNGQEPYLNDNPDTIQILKDISLPVSLNIEETKNVVLDLNGHSISLVGTSAGMTPVFSIDGKLKIIDTKENGSITHTNYSTIINNASGILEVEDGDIINGGAYNAIKNNGKFTAGQDANIIADNSRGYAVYNEFKGDILDGSGTLNGNVYTASTIDTGFSGYTMNNGIFTIENNTDLTTISNISGSAKVYNKKNSKLIDSEFGDIDNRSTLVIDGTKANKVTSSGNVSTTIVGQSEIINGTDLAGTVTIGENDGTINQEYPKISGDPNALSINSSATLNYYDGSLTGKKDRVIVSFPTNTTLATNAHIEFENVDSTNEKYFLSDDYVAAIGEDKYITISAAVEAVMTNEETEIDILKDHVITEQVVIPGEKNIKLDINNHELRTYGNERIVNNGTLTMYSSPEVALSSMKKFRMLSGTNTIINNGTLNVDNVSFDSGSIKNNGTAIINNGIFDYTVIRNDGTLTINGGTYNFETSGIIHNSSTGNVTINGGTFNQKRTTDQIGYDYIAIYNYGLLTVNDITYKAPNTRYNYVNYFVMNIGGTANILGGSYTYYVTLVYNSYPDTTTVSVANIKNVNATVQRAFVNMNNYSTVNMENSTIRTSISNSSYREILQLNYGTLNIKDCDLKTAYVFLQQYPNATLVMENSSLERDGGDESNIISGSNVNITIKNSSIINKEEYAHQIISGSGNLTIEDSIIKDASYIPAIATSNKNIIIFNGDILIKGDTEISSYVGVGIYFTGTLTLGEKDGNVSTEKPLLKGSLTNGYMMNVGTNSTFNFYDGLFHTRPNKAISGVVSDIEEGYDVVNRTIYDEEQNPTDEYTYLSTSALVVNTTTGEEYNLLQPAIDAASNGDTLQFVRIYMTLPNTQSFVIPEGKDITIDLNGHDITQNNTDSPLFINRGNLTILDSISSLEELTKTSIKNNTSNDVIDNEGTLNILNCKVLGKVDNDGTMEVMHSTVNEIDNSSILNVEEKATVLTLTNSGSASLDNSYVDTKITNNGTATITGCTIKTLEDNTGNITFEDDGASTTITNYNIQNDTTIDSSEMKITNITADGVVLNIDSVKSLTKVTLSNQSTLNLGAGINLNQIIASTNSIVNVTNSNIVKITLDNAKTSILNFYDGSVIEGIRGGAEVNIYSGTIKGGIGSGGGSIEYAPTTINIGTKDGNVVISSPIITNENKNVSSNEYGVMASGEVHFYDGKVHNIDSTKSPIYGNITDIEPGYTIVIDSNNDEYLSTNDIIRNETQNRDYKSLSTAITEANTGDELKVLVDFVIDIDDITIPSTKEISLDLDGHTILGSQGRTITNEGKLTITDTSQDHDGMIKDLDGDTRFKIVNNNILNIENGHIVCGMLNNQTLNINDGYISDFDFITGHSYDDYRNRHRITNTGTLTINGGLINHYVENKGAFIMNDGRLENGYVSSGIGSPNSSLHTISHISDAENNIYATGTINGGNLKGNMGITKDSIVTINDATGEIRFENDGELNINGGTFTHSVHSQSSATSDYVIRNNNVVNINGGIFQSTYDISDSRNTVLKLLYTYGNSNVYKTANIKNATIGFNLGYFYYANIDIDNVTTDYGFYSTRSNVSIENSAFNGGTIDPINLDYNTLFVTITNSTIKNPIVSNGRLNIVNSTILSETGTAIAASSGTLNIDSSSSVTSTVGIAIDSSATVTIGTGDGIYDSTSPIISGKTYGISGSTLYFYDGTISGETKAMNLTSVAQTEPNYVVDTNRVGDVEYATQKLQGDNEKVIVFNNINYTSLQAAVNASVADTNNKMVLYTDYTLPSNVSIPENRTITLYLNDHTFTLGEYAVSFPNTSSFSIETGVPEGLGGAIYKFFADITGTPINAKNVIVYQMDDGNALVSTETYKLFQLIDGSYKIVQMKEDSLGNYTYSGMKEKLSTIKGKLYLNGLDQGTYKLVSSNNRELDFVIEDYSVSPNIRLNENSSPARVESSAIAILILTFSTGMLRTPWIILIMLIMLLTLTTIVITKKRTKRVLIKEDINEERRID